MCSYEHMLISIISAWFTRVRAHWLSRGLNQPYRRPKHQSNHLAIGRYGEQVAADWLQCQGCSILARNFRPARGGEVDLIARDGKLLLFIEVKTRHTSSRIRPLDAVDREKRLLIERGANAWLRRLGTRQLPWRFDVIEVRYHENEPPRINHVRNAF